MRKFRFSLLTQLALLVVFPSLLAVAAPGRSAVVKIDSGKVRGLISGNLAIFKGIPYAAPPVGSLRWRPPQPVKPWRGIRAATEYGHDCMQLPFPNDAAPLRTQPSEDCLYLNVWAPRKHPAKPLPVMLWIYGGGFVNGGSSPAPYDGSHFAQKGLIFVSFNYRLGRFGFFAFPALLKEGGPVGNYALMDQLAALKWVQRNIASFGGDPRQVTIFGESAGGRSVNVLLTSPAAKGLFTRAMIESGGGRNNLLPADPLNHPAPDGRPSAVQIGINFAHRMGIDGAGKKALAELRALPAEQIVNGINMATMGRQADTYSGVMIDGRIVTGLPEGAYKSCRVNPASVVVGANSADIGRTPGKTAAAILSVFGKDAAAARRAFHVKPSTSVAALAAQVGRVEMMIEPARFVAQRVTACGRRAYEYRFSYVATPLRGKFPGAFHSSEIPYVFDTLRESSWGNMGEGLTPEDLQLAAQMNSYWANFAKTGDPNGPGLPHWPRFVPSSDQLMNFTEAGPTGEVDSWAEQLNLVEKIQK